MSNLNSRSSVKISGSGQNVIVVPVRLAGLTGFSLSLGLPRSYSWCQSLPSPDDLDLEALGEGVDDRDADAVETTGDLVAAALLVELPTGVERGQDDLYGRLADPGVAGLIVSTGMPRPLSATLQPPSARSSTTIRSQ